MRNDERRKRAWREGQEAVRRKPTNSPENPYDEDKEPDLAQAWADGATSAGWNEIYTNGVLNKGERK